ncbi:Fc.00g093130.m01.CDS01 [Cosmosporella sp. VM-42]
MASPLKTLVLRYPCQAAAAAKAAGRTASFMPKASFSTARPVCLARPAPLRQQCIVASVPKTFARANSGQPPKASPNLADGAHASLKATPGKNNAAEFSKQAASTSPTLDWNTFFKLRLRRRRIQLLFSVTSGILSGGFGAVFLSTGLAEPVISQIPLDPFMTLGLMTFACSGMGWLAGPSIGSQVFYMLNRTWKKQMTQKEAQFFARIKKHRVDPSNSSAGNPVPDFYGEKIQSVSGYRQWLKDQKAFNKKKTAAFV